MSDSDDEILASLEVPMAKFYPSSSTQTSSSQCVPSETKKAKKTNESDFDLSDSLLANISIPSPSKVIPTSTTVSTKPLNVGSSTSDATKPNVSTSTLPPAVRTAARNNCILVNPKQRGNPILKSITNVPWEFEDGILADYVVGLTAGILFLSLRYHQLNPDYIHGRLKDLGKRYELRILLVLVDTKVSILLTMEDCVNVEISYSIRNVKLRHR